MTRTHNPTRLSRPAIERSLEQLPKERIKEIQERITGDPKQPFLAGLKDRIEEAHAGEKKIAVGGAELRALVARELAEIQKASLDKKSAVDLAAVQKNFGSFAARLLRTLYTKQEGRVEERKSDRTHRTVLIEKPGPAADAPAGLKPFRKYFDANAGALPSGEDKLPAGFSIAQARWFHRQYWDAPAYTSLDDLIAAAKKDPLFEDHKKIESWQVQRLWAAFPESFPWRWPTRNTILASYLLVDAMLKAPAGTSRRQAVNALREENPKIPDPTAFNNFMSGPWKTNPELYPFLEVLPKDKSGRVVLEAQGKVEVFQTDGSGRLSLTQGLADKVKALAADPRVRWDWKPDDFVDFVRKETGSDAFIWATFLNLRKKFGSDFPTWPEVTGPAMERMARQIRDIKDENEGITQKEVTQRLNEQLAKGEKPWTDNQLETVYRNHKEIVGTYIGEKKNKTQDEARELLEALKNRAPGETQYQVAARLGHGEMRAKYLLGVASTLEPEAFKEKSAYEKFSPEDDRMLEKGMALLPIGSTPSDLYALMEEKFPKYVERHALVEPKRIAKQVAQRLELSEDWVTHQQTLLARALAEACKKLPDDASFSDAIAEARKKHEIVPTEGVIRNSTYRWKSEIAKYPEIAKLLDAHGRFPWEKIRAKPAALGITRWAGEYEASSKAPRIAKGETIAGFDQKQAQVLHRLYWSLPADTELTDLIKAARSDEAFKVSKDLEPVTVNKLFRELRDYFPWEMRARRFALQSFLLTEAIENESERTPFTKLIARMQEDYTGFPDATTFTRAAKTVWRDEPERFPFIDRLRGEDGELSVVGRVPAEGFAMKGQRLELNETLARAVEKLSRDPRIRYDWEAEDFRAFLEKELGVPMKETNLQGLRRKFDFVPNWADIRKVARENFVELIGKLHEEQKINSATEMLNVLHEKHGYPLYDLTRFNTLRAEFGSEKVPIFREAKKQETLEACEAFLAAIKKSHKKRGLYEIAAQDFGWTRPETVYRLEQIHKVWPDALPGLNPARPYTAADRKMMKSAIDDAPVGASVADVARILRSEYPEFFENHPLANEQVLHGVLKRELGIESWRELQHERLMDAVVHLGKRTPRGASFNEFYGVLRDEYAVEFSREQVARLLKRWKTEADEHPELAKLLDAGGKYPWEAGVEMTEALAAQVAKVVEKNPGKSLREIVALLNADHVFAHENPGFAIQHLIDLRQRFGLIPYLDDLAEKAKEARAHAGDTKKIATKIASIAEDTRDKGGLTARYFARKLNVSLTAVREALQRHPEMFPWSKDAPGGKVDLALAMHVGRALEQAPLGTTLEQVVADLKKDKDFRALYPAFDLTTIDRLREEHPKLVPDWGARERMLALRELANAVLTAKKGTSFEAIYKKIEKEHPGVYRAPDGDKPKRLFWAATIERATALHSFLSALKVGGKIQLDGHGKPALADSTRSEVERFAREMPQIPETLPLLDKLLESAPKTALKDFEGLFVQHLLGTTVPLLEAAKAAGMNPGRATVIGTAYASNATVAAVLRDKDWDARPMPLDLGAWKEEVRSVMYQRVKSALDNGRRILVVDDGGMVSQLLREDPYLRDHAKLFTIVEQTRRGITVADESDIQTPLINVAQSLSKAFVEGPMIGGILTDKLTTRLERLGIKSVKGMRIGIVGKGAIGNPLAEELRAMGAIVTCRDNDQDKLTAAEKKLSAKDFFGGQDLILGATGQPSIGPDELALIKDGTIIGSCSSKLVEIDMGTLERGAKAKGGRTEIADGESFPPSVRYVLPDGRTITVLAKGYPLNFDGSVHSVDPDKIQLTRALLFLGMLQAAKSKVPDAHRLQIDGQIKVLEHFATLPTAKSDPDLQKTIQETLAKLRHSKTDAQAHRVRAPKSIPAR